MPSRKAPLIKYQIHHVFNRGVNKKPIFHYKRDYQRVVNLINYYKYKKTPLSYSRFIAQSESKKEEIFRSLKIKKRKKVELIAFCLMPNHFHLLLKQLDVNGISNYMREFQNSYARYFNTKNNNTGPLLEGRFKAVRIEDDNQLIHVSRYIHLNPFSSFIVKDVGKLNKYPWSSFTEYIDKKQKSICSAREILKMFKNSKKYVQFVTDHADYKKSLKKINHLSLDVNS